MNDEQPDLAALKMLAAIVIGIDDLQRYGDSLTAMAALLLSAQAGHDPASPMVSKLAVAFRVACALHSDIETTRTRLSAAHQAMLATPAVETQPADLEPEQTVNRPLH